MKRLSQIYDISFAVMAIVPLAILYVIKQEVKKRKEVDL